MAALSGDTLLSRLPIIVILGATGTGKSKLGLQIAKKFNGEIISADSMQVYKGLDIVTNKVTEAEQKEARHHLLDFLNPNQYYTVVDFRDRAIPIIDDLLSKKKLPVIVGGTNYYIESLLWKVLIQDKPADEVLVSERDSGKRALDIDSDDDEGKEKRVKTDAYPEEMCFDVSRLHDKLKKVDPERAAELHPNNVRKIIRKDDSHEENPPFSEYQSTSQETTEHNTVISTESSPSPLTLSDPSIQHTNRINSVEECENICSQHGDLVNSWSLEVYNQTGRKHSDLLKEQREAGGSQLGGPLRYTDTLIFWIQSDQRRLDARLDARVDVMISEGLIDELLDFHDRYNKLRMKEDQPPDYTKGIFQSIGFKEFHEYMMLDEESRKSEKGQKLFKEGVEAMKCVTRQYSRRQVKWIRNRILGKPERQTPPVYGLNASNVSLWEEKVYKPAIEVVESYMSLTPCAIKPLPIVKKGSSDPAALTGHHFCDICERTFVGNLQWGAHLSSKKHARAILKKEKDEQIKLDEEKAGLKEIQGSKSNCDIEL